MAERAGDGSGRASRPGRRAVGLAGLGAGALLCALALAWYDVVPGGWRLRAWLGQTEAWADARRRQHRAERLAAFAAEPTGPVDVLLLGSSTIERAGGSFLATKGLDGGVRTVRNRGIGDEPVAGLLDRLDEALEDGDPRLVVLYAASVDARRPTGADGSWRPLDAVAADVRLALDRLAQAAPSARVLVLGVLPETTPREPAAGRIEALNQRLRSLTEGRAGARFVPTWRPPLVAGGALAPGCAADRLHLNPEGYRQLESMLQADAWVLAAGPK